MQLEDGKNSRSLHLTAITQGYGIRTSAKLGLLTLNVIEAIPHKQYRIAVLILETLKMIRKSNVNPDFHPFRSG